MNIGCLMIPNSKDIMLFGGFNAYGDYVEDGKVVTIENEDKGLHKYQANLQFSIEEGDTFPNAGCVYKQGDLTFMVGTQNIWMFNEKDRKITQYLEIEV